MLGPQVCRRAASLRTCPAARLALSRTMTAAAGSVPDSTSTPPIVEVAASASSEAADPAPIPSPGVNVSESSFSPSGPRPWKPRDLAPCAALESIRRIRPDYHDIFMPSRLLMGALTVPMNSQGGPIMDRRDGRDFAVSIEREHPDVRSSRATLEQRLLKNGDRLLTLGEIEGAIGARNSFVWTMIWALLKKYKSPGMESLKEEVISRDLFSRLPSLGINKAHALAFKGLRTLNELMFDPQVKPKVKNYIRLLEVQDRTIPRPEMEEFRERLANALAGAVPKYHFELVGAYRRGSLYPQSIKVLVWNESFDRVGQDAGAREVYHLLEQDGLLQLDNMLGGGPNSPPTHTWMQALSSLGEDRPLRHLELRIVPIESVPYRLFWDTGASWLVGHMKRQAKRRGLELWPGGMQPLGQDTAILVNNERELFELLDVPWIEPMQRSTKDAHTMLPKLRAWSSASRPSADYLHRVLKQATVVKPGRVHPTNVPEIVAASRLPLPKERTLDVPAFPKINVEGGTTDIDLVQRRAAASLSSSRFEAKELARVERLQKRANAAKVTAEKASESAE